jgi:hypothetical protein
MVISPMLVVMRTPFAGGPSSTSVAGDAADESESDLGLKSFLKKLMVDDGLYWSGWEEMCGSGRDGFEDESCDGLKT